MHDRQLYRRISQSALFNNNNNKILLIIIYIFVVVDLFYVFFQNHAIKFNECVSVFCKKFTLLDIYVVSNIIAIYIIIKHSYPPYFKLNGIKTTVCIYKG